MENYRSIPIHECGEKIVPIPREVFAFFAVHPYVAAGAPYGAVTPWMLRESVLQALIRAQDVLQQERVGWGFKLFDAYRPNAVQAYMVNYEMAVLARHDGVDLACWSSEQETSYRERVLRIYAVPSEDPATPSPHSTAAVIDLTLHDARGYEVDMGSPIDENSDRSLPDYYIAATDEAGRAAHANRRLLARIMRGQGFHCMAHEWWHFSLGDQMWAFIENGGRVGGPHVARYGRADALLMNRDA